MTICFGCKHLIRVWADGTAGSRALGRMNFGCKVSVVEPVVHPVTGKIIGSEPSVMVQTEVDKKTISRIFYEICEDVNHGECPNYEALPNPRE